MGEQGFREGEVGRAPDEAEEHPDRVHGPQPLDILLGAALVVAGVAIAVR